MKMKIMLKKYDQKWKKAFIDFMKGTRELEIGLTKLNPMYSYKNRKHRLKLKQIRMK